MSDFLREISNKIEWTPGVDYPEWMEKRSVETLKGGYMIDDETPKDAMKRIAKAVNKYIPSSVYDGDLYEAVFNAMWEGDVCPSVPNGRRNFFLLGRRSS
jgi:ribonucleoside-diphosphate reductase alpha chain